ncbi:MAG: hypothetical protein ACTSUT_06940 [Promethearchaeota archaeon]
MALATERVYLYLLLEIKSLIKEKKLKNGMSNKKANKEINDLAEEKILYGEDLLVCFACGAKIKKNTNICPYCKTKQNKRNSVSR